jgi:hypothetical protein
MWLLKDDYKLRYCFSALRESLTELKCSCWNICVAIQVHREYNFRLILLQYYESVSDIWYDSLEDGSARQKVCAYTEHNTNDEKKHICFKQDSNPRSQGFLLRPHGYWNKLKMMALVVNMAKKTSFKGIVSNRRWYVGWAIRTSLYEEGTKGIFLFEAHTLMTTIGSIQIPPLPPSQCTAKRYLKAVWRQRTAQAHRGLWQATGTLKEATGRGSV